MVGRFLAICGWLAFGLRRSLTRLPLVARRPLGAAWGAVGLIAALALVPIALALADPQPEDAMVEQVREDEVGHADGWIRLHGRIVPLAEAPTTGPGSYGLLIDADDLLDAIVLRSTARIEPAVEAMVTGRLAPAPDGVLVTERLPIEATVAGTPPRVVSDRVVELDPTPKPERQIAWYLVVPLALMAGLLAIGLRAGYPVFRASREIDVLARPLAPGERIPSAVAGRLETHRIPSDAPIEALVLIGRGPRGNVPTVQLVPGDGRYPAPIPLWSGWSGGRTGYLYTLREELPAIVLRTDRVDAVLIFAKRSERDRVAAMVAVDRS